MRNLKRALSLTLASVMLLGMMVVGTSAAAGYDDVKETDNVEAIEVLQEIEVMVGDERGFGPDRPVNRAEMAVVMGKLLSLDYDYYSTSCPFNDVYDWARGWVGAAYANKIVSGRSATVYDPGASVTAVEAASMLMRALGYFQYSNDVADGFELSTVRQGTRIGIFNGVGSSATEPMTRNQVAQMVLNALRTGTVEPDGNTINLTTPDGLVYTGRVNYVNVTSDQDYARAISTTQATAVGSENRGVIVELGEQLYKGDLRLNNDERDVFGRPARKWDYKGEEIGTYAKKEQLRKSWTVKVEGGDVYSDVGAAASQDYPMTYWVNGVRMSNADAAAERANFERRNDDQVGTTGKGVLTEAYVDTTKDDEKLTIVEIHTYLAYANNDYDSRNDKLSINIYEALNGKDDPGQASEVILTRSLSGEDFDIDGYEQDDLMLVTYAGRNKEVQSVAEPELVADVYVNSYSTGDHDDNDKAYMMSSVTADGTKYDAAYDAVWDPEYLYNYDTSNGLLKMKDHRYNLYLDQYGYVIGLENVKANTNYAFLVGYQPESDVLAKTIDRALVILIDEETGTATMKTTKAQVKDLSDDDKGQLFGTGETDFKTGAVNKWITYTMDGDVMVIDSAVDTQYIDGTATVIDKENVTLEGDLIDDDDNDYGNDNASVVKYGNTKTVYVAVDADYSVVAGTGGPPFTAGGSIVDINGTTVGVRNTNIDVGTGVVDASGAYVLFESGSGYIKYAVVVGENTGSQNFVYLTKLIKQADRDDEKDKDVFIYEGFVNGTFSDRIESLVSWSGAVKNGPDLKEGVIYKAKINSDGRITQMDAQADNWEDATQTDNRTDGYVQATSGVTTNTVTLGADTKVWLKDQTLYIHTENTNERYVQLDDNVRFHIRGTDENGKRDGSYTTYTNARSAMNRLGAQQADDSYLFTGNLVAVCDPATGFATAVIIKDTKFEAPANTPAPDDDDDDGETHAAATMNYGLLELASLTTVDGDWRTPVMNRLIADGYTITGWTTTGGSEAVSASKNGSSFTFDCSAAVAAATEYFTIKVDGEVVEEVVKNGTSTKKWNDVKPSTNYGTGYLDSSDDYVAYGTGTDPISSNMTAAIVIKPGYVSVPKQVTIGTATAHGVTVVQNAANTNDYVRAGGSVTYEAKWHTGGNATTDPATISVTLDGSATGATASVSPASVAAGANHAAASAQTAIRVANAGVTTVTLSAG